MKQDAILTTTATRCAGSAPPESWRLYTAAGERICTTLYEVVGHLKLDATA